MYHYHDTSGMISVTTYFQEIRIILTCNSPLNCTDSICNVLCNICIRGAQRLFHVQKQYSCKNIETSLNNRNNSCMGRKGLVYNLLSLSACWIMNCDCLFKPCPITMNFSRQWRWKKDDTLIYVAIYPNSASLLF